MWMACRGGPCEQPLPPWLAPPRPTTPGPAPSVPLPSPPPPPAPAAAPARWCSSRSRTAAAGAGRAAATGSLAARLRRPSPPPGAAPSPPRPAGCPRRAPGTGPANGYAGSGAAGFLQPAETPRAQSCQDRGPAARESSASASGGAAGRTRGRPGTLPVTPEWEGRGRDRTQCLHVTTVPFSLTVSSSEAPVRKTVVLTEETTVPGARRAQPRTFMASALAATCEEPSRRRK